MTQTLPFTPGTKAIWRNGGPDLPITITGIMKVQDGVTWYSTAEYLGGTPENQIILDMDDDDDLLDSFKMFDELQVDQEKEAINQRNNLLDGLITAIGGVSVAATFVAADEKMRLLRALVPMATQMELNAQDIERVKETLTSFGWEEAEQSGFLEACELTPPPPTFHPYTFEELEAMPPKEWIIDQILGRGDLGMVFSPPGQGKTFVVADLAICAIMGKPWAMRFDVSKPLSVAYCAGEGISGLPVRFIAAATHHGATRADKSNFTFFKTVPQFYTDDDTPEANAIRQFVIEWQKRQDKREAKPLDLLIVDTLHTATVSADENSAKDMGKVLSMCRWATQELDCAILLVHHTNKNGTAERGSSALRGAMDVMIEIKRTSENDTKATMSCEKLKDGESWRQQTLDLVPIQDVDSVRVWWDEPSNSSEGDKRKTETAREILELLAEKPDRSLPAKKIAETIAKLPQSVNKVLARLVKDTTVKRSEDKRGTIVFAITDEGIKALSQPGKV